MYNSSLSVMAALTWNVARQNMSYGKSDKLA